MAKLILTHASNQRVSNITPGNQRNVTTGNGKRMFTNMAASAKATKPVLTPNSYLLCSLCNELFTDPVINVKCGHTFCRACLQNSATGYSSAKCPVDDSTCELSALVVNR